MEGISISTLTRMSCFPSGHDGGPWGGLFSRVRAPGPRAQHRLQEAAQPQCPGARVLLPALPAGRLVGGERGHPHREGRGRQEPELRGWSQAPRFRGDIHHWSPHFYFCSHEMQRNHIARAFKIQSPDDFVMSDKACQGLSSCYAK